MRINDNTPVLVGVGQVVQRDKPQPGQVRSALDFAADASRRAIADAQAQSDLKDHIDTVVAVRLFEHSTRKVAIVTNPLGESNNVPGSIAKRLDIKPQHSIYAARRRTITTTLDQRDV